MPERLSSDGGTVIVLRQTEVANLPAEQDGAKIQLFWVPGLGLRVKEFGKDAVDPAQTAADAAAALLGGVRLYSGSADPTDEEAGGVEAAIPALYVKTDDGTVWSKTGPEDTDWTQLAFAA